MVMSNDRRALRDFQTVWQHALAEDSNRELDWLWLYTQAQTDEQRRFSLQKALRINCRNPQTHRLLKQLGNVVPSRRSHTEAGELP
jgi:hypothetical protein